MVKQSLSTRIFCHLSLQREVCFMSMSFFSLYLLSVTHPSFHQSSHTSTLPSLPLFLLRIVYWASAKCQALFWAPERQFCTRWTRSFQQCSFHFGEGRQTRNKYTTKEKVRQCSELQGRECKVTGENETASEKAVGKGPVGGKGQLHRHLNVEEDRL